MPDASSSGRRDTAAPADPRWESRQVRVGGLDIRVAVRPHSSDRPPLLLMNGLGASLEMLAPFAAALPDEIGLIAFDVPGTGRSQTPSRPYTMRHLSNVVADLIDELGYDVVDVLGISWGGLLAQHFAGHHPTRARRVVLVSTAPTTGAIPGGLRVVGQLMSRRRYTDIEYAKKIAGEVYGGTVRDHPELVEILQSGSPATSCGYAFQWLAGVSGTFTPVYPLISQPTLVIACDDDPIIPVVNGRIISLAIPAARLEVVAGGHLLMLTDPATIASIVEPFLAKRSIRRRGAVPASIRFARACARVMVPRGWPTTPSLPIGRTNG